MNSQAVENERQLLSCFDEVLDAPASERLALVRSRFGSDEKLVRDLEQLLAAAERTDATCLADSVDAVLQPVLADLADHSVTQAEIPSALVQALAPRYTILERIGRGGMASVYLAFDTTLGRHVAIKSMRPELADGIGLERFAREITIAATVDHPRIVPVYDRGSADGLLYYVMRYVEGGSLRDLLLERPQLEIRSAIEIARDVAEALDAAHAKKIVHRDIKPANILLDERGAHVADFGVARLIDAAGPESLTRSGIALGTALYMSPEQAGSVSKVDGRSDVYALACVLYEMLAGEAPFNGPSQRDIVAKHLAATIPDLTVVRATITRPMQQVIATALQKSPADRFATAGEFIDAFERAYLAPDRYQTAGDFVLATPRIAAARRRAAVRVAVLAGGLAAAAAVWLWLGTPSLPLDARKIVVFPLLQVGQTADRSQGETVALMIGSALEHTEPLKWIYGWTWLDASRRADISLLDASFARRIARERGAKFFVDGSIVGHGDSTSVILRLVDTEGDSVVAQATRSGLPEQAALLGLRAINELLPRVLDPGRKVHLELLAGISPGSTAAWLQGEREFRRSRFGTALAHYRKALDEDSAMTLAAVKGAEAAWWANQDREGLELARIAVAGKGRLPLKYAHMAQGLQAFLEGIADSAVHHFGRAVEQDSTWADGWMALGDAYYHLVPARPRPDSVAEAAFVTSQRLDPEFSPPLLHLAEFALRRQEGDLARRLATAFQRSSPDSAWTKKLDLMIACVRRGATRMDWRDAAQRHPDVVVQAAKAFSAGGANLACAEGGFRAAYTADSSAVSTRWGALLGLNAVLIAQGRGRDARAQLDSALSSGLRAARGLYAVNTAAGEPMDSMVRVVVEDWGSTYDGMPLSRLWHQALWATHQRDTTALSAMLAAIRKASDSSMMARSMAGGLEARLVLARGDSASAIRLLEQLHAFGMAADVSWGLWQPQAFERLLLSELFLARGRFRDALRVASEFDNPQPILYVACLPRSLQVRYQAALALGERGQAEEYAARLRSLGRRDLLLSRSQ